MSEHIDRNLDIATNFIFDIELPKGINKSFLAKVVKRTQGDTGWYPVGIVSVSFITKLQSKELNNQFAGNNYPTDVLSFDYDSKEHLAQKIDNNHVAGEIVICTQIAIEQSADYGIDLKSEIALLLIHGILHLSGLDHQNKSQKTRFESIQSGILKSLNLMYRKMPW